MIVFIIGLLICVLSTLTMLRLITVRTGVIVSIIYYIVYALVFFAGTKIMEYALLN